MLTQSSHFLYLGENLLRAKTISDNTNRKAPAKNTKFLGVIPSPEYKNEIDLINIKLIIDKYNKHGTIKFLVIFNYNIYFIEIITHIKKAVKTKSIIDSFILTHNAII